MPPRSPLWATAFDRFSRAHPGVRLLHAEGEAVASLSEVDALVAARIDAEQLLKATSLKALFLPLTGLNHLPLELLQKRDIEVYNLHANAESVAQNALAMTLAFFGRLIEFHNDLRTTRWHGFWVGKGAEDEWSSIFGKRCAILGTGAIGQALAGLFKAFRFEVVGYRLHPTNPLPPGFDRVEAILERALAGADIVVSTLPLTAATRGLLGRKELEAMRGAFLVNVGRGEVIEEEALYLALREGVIAGAGIDVWYTYPGPGETMRAPSRFPIHELANVVLSPHVGGSTREASRDAAGLTLANLASWLEKGVARNRVDLSEGF